MNINFFMNKALEQAKLALLSEEVPVGAVLVDNKTNEYNLTDIINIYIEERYRVNPILVNEFWRLMGINTLNDIELLKSYDKNEKK